MVEKLLVEAIGGATALYAVAFSYYALKNARLMYGPIGHRLMAAGGVFFVLTVAIGAVGEFLNLSLGTPILLTWLVALLLVVAGGISRVKAVTKVYKIPLLKALLTFKHEKYYLFSVLILVFVSVPLLLLDILIKPGYDWFSVGTALVWTVAFVLLTVSERSLGMKALIKMEKVPHKLWRKDIQMLRARLDITNGYLGSLAAVASMGPLNAIVDKCSKENRRLLRGYKLELPGKLALEPLVENLNVIPARNKEREIFKTFTCLDSNLVAAYARLTSPQNATYLVNESFVEAMKIHGAVVQDYALPALTFRNVLEPLLLGRKKSTIEEIRREIAKSGKKDPLVRGVMVEDDGRIDLSAFYQSLVILQREERIKRAEAAFFSVREAVSKALEEDLGPEIKKVLDMASSKLKSDFPELKKTVTRGRAKVRK